MHINASYSYIDDTMITLMIQMGAQTFIRQLNVNYLVYGSETTVIDVSVGSNPIFI